MSVPSNGNPPRAGRVRRTPWALLALAVFFCGIAGVQVAVTGNPDLQNPLFGVSFLVLDVLGVIFSARAAWSRRLTPAQRRPWRFMVPALVSHTVSTIGFAAAAVGEEPAAEWVGIIARLAMVPMLLAAILTFPMRSLAPSERYKLGLDATTVAGGGFVVLWYFIIGPGLTSGGSVSLAVSLAGFPIGDLILIFGVCAVLLRGGVTRWRHPLTILLGGLVVFLAADVYYSYSELQHRGAELSLGTRLWLLSGTFLMVVAAAYQVQPVGEPAGRQPGAGAGGVSHLPYAGLAVGYFLLLFATAREGSFFPWGGLVVGSIVMTGAVAVRQLIAMRENHQLVVTDNLTGLANRVRVRARLEQACQRQQEVAVLLIDLDGFKQVNDTLGHEAGDALLAAFGEVLRSNVRPSDLAGRLGGDEFAVVLAGTTTERAAGLLADRIIAAAAVPVPLADTVAPIRCSIGIAMARPDDSVEDLLHRADVAMYAAKRAGRHGWASSSGAIDRQLDDPGAAPDTAEAPGGQLQMLG